MCESEILKGKEHLRTIKTLDELKLGLPDRLVALLETNDADRASWCAAEFIVDNERWGDYVVLATDEDGDKRIGKFVRIMSPTLFKVDSFEQETYVTTEQE